MNENTPDSPPPAHNENQPMRPPKRPLPPWALLLPIALLAGGWWMMNRQPHEPESFMGEAPALENTVPVPTAQPKPTAKPTPTRPKPSGSPVKITVFVPDDMGTLQRRVVTAADIRNTELPTSPDTSYKFIASRAMEILLEQAPDNFPAGTRLLSLKQKSGSNVVEADFNEKFAQPDFWQGSTQTQMTVYSIVNTLAAVPNPAKKVRVQLLVKGKRVETLGELDATDPFDPDLSLVGKG